MLDGLRCTIPILCSLHLRYTIKLVCYRMKQIVTNQTVKIPEGLTVTVKSRLVTVKGPRGILKRSFKHLALDIRVSKLIYYKFLWVNHVR